LQEQVSFRPAYRKKPHLRGHFQTETEDLKEIWDWSVGPNTNGVGAPEAFDQQLKLVYTCRPEYGG